MERELNIGWDSDFNSDRAVVENPRPGFGEWAPDPCEGCALVEQCAADGRECMAFRNWAVGEKWSKHMVGKHLRAPQMTD